MFMLSACSLAPDYQPPVMPVPAAFREAGNDWAAAQPADDAPKGEWWKAFHDPILDALEAKVTDANQNLKIAVAQYDEAHAAVTVANADYFPSVTGSSGALRERSSGKAFQSTLSHFNDFSLGASTSYEVDIWGRVRNEVAAAKGAGEASAADLATINLSLHAELASDYFALRGLDSMQTVINSTLSMDQKAVDLLQDRLRIGSASDADVAQAETQLETVRTQDIDTKLQRAQLADAIAVLTGTPPSDFRQGPIPLKDNQVLPRLALGVPSLLLERRPDIAAAERRAYAANAEIGVARAAWFPTFSLTGSIGYESASAGNWLSVPSQFWTIGPTTALTLFDAGRISALSEEARAAYAAAAASYRQTVLSAYQDVEDNLTALHKLADEEKSESAAAAAAQRALMQEKNLYLGGDATYIDVAVSQNQALTAQLALINIRVRRMVAAVNLIKALGGGWQKADLKEATK